MSIQVFIAFDADHAGRLIGNARLQDNPYELRKISSTIDKGNSLWKSWAENHGGSMISSGGDEGILEVGAVALNDLQQIKHQYEQLLELTVSIGVGSKMSQAFKALMAAKLRGRNRVVFYDKEVEEDVQKAIEEGEGDETKKIVDEYLHKAEDLEKGIKDILVGEKNSDGLFDYTHVLTPKQRKEGYSLTLRDGFSSDFQRNRRQTSLEVYIKHNNRPVGGVEAETNSISGKNITPHSSISVSHRGKGLGVAAYTALYVHAKSVGFTHVRGGFHSDAAKRVHESLSKRFGFKYESKTDENEKGVFRNKPYVYALKAELSTEEPQLDESKLEPVYFDKDEGLVKHQPIHHTGKGGSQNDVVGAAEANPDIQQQQILKDMPEAPFEGGPDYEEEFRQLADASEKKDNAQKAQKSQDYQALKQQVAQALAAIHEQLPQLGKIKQAAPDTYQAILGVVQGIIALGKEISNSEEKLQKAIGEGIGEVLEKGEDDLEHRKAKNETGFWGRKGAGAIVRSRKTGRILLPLRSHRLTSEPLTWGTWGGAIDSNENEGDAAIRELREESGYKGPVKLTPMAVFEKGPFKYHNFLAEVDDEFHPSLDWENDDARWFHPHELHGLNNLHFGVKNLINHPPSRQLMGVPELKKAAVDTTHNPLLPPTGMKGTSIGGLETYDLGLDKTDLIPGGIADKKQPGDFDQEQLGIGTLLEMEHTKDENLAREIAMDHLAENPNYYRDEIVEEQDKNIDKEPLEKMALIHDDPKNPRVVYRVQTGEGYGPYQYSKAFSTSGSPDSKKYTKYVNGVIFKLKRENTPGPRDDFPFEEWSGKDYEERNKYRFGFDSPKSAQKWFGTTFKHLPKYGYNLVPVKASKVYRSKSGRQIIFIPHESEKTLHMAKSDWDMSEKEELDPSQKVPQESVLDKGTMPAHIESMRAKGRLVPGQTLDSRHIVVRNANGKNVVREVSAGMARDLSDVPNVLGPGNGLPTSTRNKPSRGT